MILYSLGGLWPIHQRQYESWQAFVNYDRLDILYTIYIVVAVQMECFFLNK